jgi:hypothetical protein
MTTQGAPDVTIRGVRMTIPPGYVLGRIGLSAGPARLVSIKELGDALTKAAAVAIPLGVAVEVTNTGIGTGFWSDVDGSASVWRFTRRMFIGNATTQDDTRVGVTTIIPDAATGANWAVRDSQFAVLDDRGSLAVTGISRASDGGAANPAVIGVAGFVINDSSTTQTARALYGDLQFQATGTLGYGYGLELAIKNKAANKTSTPDLLDVGTYGIQLTAGGDASYGGSPTNPSNTGILFQTGASTWNKGIIFANNSLTLVGGRGRAIGLGKNYHISWYDGNNNEAFYIVSGVATSGKGASLNITDNAWNFQDQGGNHTIQCTNTGSSTANYLNIYSNTTGNPVRLAANGSDTNITLTLEPQAAGTVHVVGSLTTDKARIDTGYGYSQPVTGGTVTLSATAYHTIIDPAGTLATLTVNMPASPVDGQVVDFRFSQVITALTIGGNGNSVAGAPTTAALGQTFTAIFKASNTTWYL